VKIVLLERATKHYS